ncbi:hypothetical protein BN000_04098 [Mycobacterium europaeum]|uniref:Uncharacterized protein n=1 Tax=Mycobacterium europaeum TaxID=761804 RepID=A0A0U1DKG3_9MYCO|nr:hypothetical protein BN000_04098 [Mycobacterium europaeum]
MSSLLDRLVIWIAEILDRSLPTAPEPDDDRSMDRHQPAANPGSRMATIPSA